MAQLCDEHVAIENQAAQRTRTMLRRLAERHLAPSTDIRLLDKRLTQMIAAEANLARRYARLTSMPGVGPVLALTLIRQVYPELGRMSRKQFASSVSRPTISTAASRGHRGRIYGGRMPVRNVLYMASRRLPFADAALETFTTSSRRCPARAKVILVVMRKMITTLNAMLRDGAGWQPQAA